MLSEQIVNEKRLARSLSLGTGVPGALALGLLAYGFCAAGLHQLETQRLWVAALAGYGPEASDGVAA